MKAREWQFQKFIPDAEDWEAKNIAAGRFFRLMAESPVEMGDIGLFTSGFWRGAAWMAAKMKETKNADR
jgi:hypothetical protein